MRETPTTCCSVVKSPSQYLDERIAQATRKGFVLLVINRVVTPVNGLINGDSLGLLGLTLRP